MAGIERTRLFAAGTVGLGTPALARVTVGEDGIALEVREHVDPAIRSGRGQPGRIAALASIRDRAGGTWLLASVERGRPRLIDPETLEVVALLGRRREWRGAAASRNPFVAVLCERAPVDGLLLSRTLAGELDLVRVCPGAAIERWQIGTVEGRARLLASAELLVIVTRERVAVIERETLVPGACPLIDPRDVELALDWRPRPPGVVAFVDLLDEPGVVRAIERRGERWSLIELDPRTLARGASAAIERPLRWLSSPGGGLWLYAGESWTRVGPGERGPIVGSELACLEHDPDGRPWLWSWQARELRRLDPLAPTAGASSRWPLETEFVPTQLLASSARPRPDLAVVVDADELAELVPLEPDLARAWPTWFGRQSSCASSRISPSSATTTQARRS